MTRRIVLTAIELALTASALTAAVCGLVHAAYDPYAPVQWVPIAVVGAGTALSFVGLAAVLFVGRAALLLAAAAVHAQQGAIAAPPSASAPLWPGNYDDQVLDAYVAERFNTRRHARQPLPTTLPMPVEELAATREETAVGADEHWTAAPAPSEAAAVPPTAPVFEYTQTQPTWGFDGRRVVEEVGR